MTTSAVFEARGPQDVAGLVAVVVLGALHGIAIGAIDARVACHRLLGPALLTRLERLSAPAELVDVVHRATELVDIFDLAPSELRRTARALEKRIASYLKSSPVHDGPERWLAPPSAP